MKKYAKRNAMRANTLVTGIAAAIASLCLSWPVLAQSNLPTSRAPASGSLPPPTIAEAADRLLKQMGAYIGSAEQFTVRADITFDHVLPSGQKLQFAAVQQIALQRPSGLYVEWGSDLGDRQLWYDGKAVTIYDPDAAFSGTESAPPTIDGMLDKLINQLNFTPPLVDFLYSDPYKNLRGSMQYGFVTGDAQINGRTCRGLAFVEKHIDWQIWIDTGPQLVPCKLVITYKNNQAFPQFSAIFSDWNFAPRVAAATFMPDLPPGTQNIPFATARANVGSR